jgi:putative two-component system response regulator
MPFNILMADDEPGQRALLREILDDGSFVITEARNGQEAVDLVSSQPFDAVLLDVRMPQLDGIAACQLIHQQHPLLPILMITGYGGQDDLLRAMQAGASDFLRKPYEPQELLARVRNAASHKRQTDQLEHVASMLFALARVVEVRDEGTGDHCSRVAHLACLFGRELGLNEEQLQTLRDGGVLHDLGKLAIPDRVLLKPGPLDDEEWAVMRQHTVIGATLCGNLRSLARVVPIVRHHHERWDGSGYPDGLAGEDIPLLARVFQFADIYDALANARHYKGPWPHEQIVAAFEQGLAAGKFDPRLAEIFLELLRQRRDELELPAEERLDEGAAIFQQLLNQDVLTSLSTRTADSRQPPSLPVSPR